MQTVFPFLFRRNGATDNHLHVNVRCLPISVKPIGNKTISMAAWSCSHWPLVDPCCCQKDMHASWADGGKLATVAPPSAVDVEAIIGAEMARAICRRQASTEKKVFRRWPVPGPAVPCPYSTSFQGRKKKSISFPRKMKKYIPCTYTPCKRSTSLYTTTPVQTPSCPYEYLIGQTAMDDESDRPD